MVPPKKTGSSHLNEVDYFLYYWIIFASLFAFIYNIVNLFKSQYKFIIIIIIIIFLHSFFFDGLRV